MTTANESDLLGLGRPPGDHHYRAFVGPPEDYDRVGALQFAALIALGMRDSHLVADVGCGSLRAGRLLIPYLQPNHYFGIEPEKWLVTNGLKRELGASAVAAKQPNFAYRDDFDLSCFQTEFDFILAHSIFSHTYADLASDALAKLAAALKPSGILLVTIVSHGASPDSRHGSGWEYPACVRYRWSEFSALLAGAGLSGVRLAWPHPRQTWVVAAHERRVNLRRMARLARWNLGSNLHHPMVVSVKRRAASVELRARHGAAQLLPADAKHRLRTTLDWRHTRRAP
jgi:SAM-dependent methyltransferase